MQHSQAGHPVLATRLLERSFRPAATDQALVADKSPAAAGKDGGRLVKHARYYWLLLAEGHLNRRLFGEMLRRIWALPVPAG